MLRFNPEDIAEAHELAIYDLDREFDGHDAASLSRYDIVASEIAKAAQDEVFRHLVVNGDDARDRCEWAEAEMFYSQALQLYPYHPGYRVQQAHMRKEQHKFQEAELSYRSALALGADGRDIKQHLDFVTERNGYPAAAIVPCNLAVPSMDAPPSVVDIEILSFLLFHDGDAVSVWDALGLIRQCPTNRDAALALIGEDRFIRANKAFLQMLRN